MASQTRSKRVEQEGVFLRRAARRFATRRSARSRAGGGAGGGKRRAPRGPGRPAPASSPAGRASAGGGRLPCRRRGARPGECRRCGRERRGRRPLGGDPSLVGGEEDGALVGEVLVERPRRIAGLARQAVRVGAVVADAVELAAAAATRRARVSSGFPRRGRFGGDGIRVGLKGGASVSGDLLRGIAGADLTRLRHRIYSDISITITNRKVHHEIRGWSRAVPPLRAAVGASSGRSVELDGVILGFDDEGEGPPVVCLHAIGHGAGDFARLRRHLAGRLVWSHSTGRGREARTAIGSPQVPSDMRICSALSGPSRSGAGRAHRKLDRRRRRDSLRGGTSGARVRTGVGKPRRLGADGRSTGPRCSAMMAAFFSAGSAAPGGSPPPSRVLSERSARPAGARAAPPHRRLGLRDRPRSRRGLAGLRAAGGGHPFSRAARRMPGSVCLGEAGPVRLPGAQPCRHRAIPAGAAGEVSRRARAAPGDAGGLRGRARAFLARSRRANRREPAVRGKTPRSSTGSSEGGVRKCRRPNRLRPYRRGRTPGAPALRPASQRHHACLVRLSSRRSGRRGPRWPWPPDQPESGCPSRRSGSR